MKRMTWKSALLILVALAIPRVSQPASEDLALHDLGTLGGTVASASGINDRGQVVGFSTDASDQGHAVLWEAGRAIDLGFENGIVQDINNRGQIIGNHLGVPPPCDEPGPCFSIGVAFIWEAGTVTELGTIGGHGSYPWDINNRGQVVGVGRAASGDDHAFLWDAGTMT